ncbi:hypothetical protein Uis4E_0927 [Bifidobacterium parmae]|uniref:Uncharacterized protein n=1 Tax=Bifidobacterium parmae TaxID=361854 RepID=A0A2N5J438_9BIFI|nr:hypothetical protein Uis4E_0927 [Bifidobacterium parmae]
MRAWAGRDNRRKNGTAANGDKRVCPARVRRRGPIPLNMDDPRTKRGFW